jgi:capsid protein
MAMRMDGRTKIESGTFVPLFPGDKLEPFLPGRPATAFGSFIDNVFRIIGCALDLPAILLLKDFSQVNYSSARAALLEAWRSFNRQRDWLGTMFLDPWYALWLEEVINDGRVAAPVNYYANRAAYNRCRWIGPARGWVDPVKEIDAVGQRLALRLSTLEDECAEQGRDWREVAQQQALEKAYYDELGLAYPGDAAPAKRGGPNSAYVAPESPYPSDVPGDGADNTDTGSGGSAAPAQKAA